MENERKNLHLPGYVHPTSTNTSRDSRYKTFNPDAAKKKKDISQFKGTSVAAQYSTFSAYAPADDDVKCPTCKSPAVDTCPCGYSDKKCENGHVWYTDREGRLKKGSPH